MYFGSEVYSCRLRGDSSGWKRVIFRVFSLPSTRARAVTISQTYSPETVPIFSCSRCRHSMRNGMSVTPAIGASTTGEASSSFPTRKLTAPFWGTRTHGAKNCRRRAKRRRQLNSGLPGVTSAYRADATLQVSESP